VLFSYTVWVIKSRSYRCTEK